jgi:hypothetical protein
MYQDGQLLTNASVRALFILLNGELFIVVNGNGQIAPTKPKSPIGKLQIHDRLATHNDIAKLLAGRPMPQWVVDMGGNVNQPSYSVGIVGPGVSSISFNHSKGLANVAEEYGIKPIPAPVKTYHEPVTLAVFQSSCPHKWKTYTGFTRVYDYCELCDAKRN